MACDFSQESMRRRAIRSTVNARILPNAEEAEKARKLLTLKKSIYLGCFAYGISRVLYLLILRIFDQSVSR